MIATIVLLVACADDDNFSTSSGLRLTFSTDTVCLDTIFSKTPSSTYTFWVHNDNDEGIHLSNVRLNRRNQTGFRVNVDGSYLDNSLGSQVNDLEIRHNDSILVFVELTSAESSQLEPKLIEDDLIFSLESGIEQKVNLRAWSWNAQKLYDPMVSGNEVIESPTPIIIYGGLTVAEGARLTIKNSTLYFHDGAGIEVYGDLIVTDCVLRGDRLDHMFDYLPYDRVSGQWLGIEIASNAEGCWLTDTEVRNAWDGIWADSTQVALVNSVVHNCRGYALYAKDSKVALDYVQLTNAENDCLSLHGCEAVVDHCTLGQFYPLTGYRGAALYYEATTWPMILDCRNTLVTGYDDNVVQVDKDQEGSLEYHFENCLLRTPEVKDEETLYVDILWESSKDEFQGKQHFLTFDEENMFYDFTIVVESPAYERLIGRAFEVKSEE